MSVIRARSVSARTGYIETPSYDESDQGQAACALAVADPSGCDWEIAPNSPIPLCRLHLVTAYQFVRSTVAATVARAAGEPKRAPKAEYVYFIRKDDLIKIGWTGNVPARMRALQPDEVLHVEPGTQKDESALHRRFAHLRACGCAEGKHLREWFYPEPDLLDYIEERKRAAA